MIVAGAPATRGVESGPADLGRRSKLAVVANIFALIAAFNMLFWSIFDLFFGYIIISVIELVLSLFVWFMETPYSERRGRPRLLYRNLAFRGVFYILIAVPAFFSFLLFIAGIFLAIAGFLYIGAHLRGDRGRDLVNKPYREEVYVVDVGPPTGRAYDSGAPQYASAVPQYSYGTPAAPPGYSGQIFGQPSGAANYGGTSGHNPAGSNSSNPYQQNMYGAPQEYVAQPAAGQGAASQKEVSVYPHPV
eukprot:ANDGO_06585.mRNA.1 hypothetical protein